jgi:hypothetical protein
LEEARASCMLTPTMSPSKKRVKSIKVHVPRHNSQRIGPALTAQIEKIANQKHIRTDVREPTNEVSSTIALAIVRHLTLALLVHFRINPNSRRVLPSGTHCYLLPVLSGDHSGISAHSSKSFLKTLPHTSRAWIIVADTKLKKVQPYIMIQVLC